MEVVEETKEFNYEAEPEDVFIDLPPELCYASEMEDAFKIDWSKLTYNSYYVSEDFIRQKTPVTCQGLTR